MNDNSYRTASGKTLTDADIEALAAEVDTTDYDTEALQTRRRGRPLLGSAPAEVVPPALLRPTEATTRSRRFDAARGPTAIQVPGAAPRRRVADADAPTVTTTFPFAPRCSTCANASWMSSRA
jgi:hypothetical protein